MRVPKYRDVVETCVERDKPDLHVTYGVCVCGMCGTHSNNMGTHQQCHIPDLDFRDMLAASAQVNMSSPAHTKLPSFSKNKSQLKMSRNHQNSILQNSSETSNKCSWYLIVNLWSFLSSFSVARPRCWKLRSSISFARSSACGVGSGAKLSKGRSNDIQCDDVCFLLDNQGDWFTIYSFDQSWWFLLKDFLKVRLEVRFSWPKPSVKAFPKACHETCTTLGCMLYLFVV